MSSSYELVDRLVAYGRAHFTSRNADDVEMPFSAGEFDLAVDAFLVSAEAEGHRVDSELLAEIEHYSMSPTPSELADEWRDRMSRIRR